MFKKLFFITLVTLVSTMAFAGVKRNIAQDAAKMAIDPKTIIAAIDDRVNINYNKTAAFYGVNQEKFHCDSIKASDITESKKVDTDKISFEGYTLCLGMKAYAIQIYFTGTLKKYDYNPSKKYVLQSFSFSFNEDSAD